MVEVGMEILARYRSDSEQGPAPPAGILLILSKGLVFSGARKEMVSAPRG